MQLLTSDHVERMSLGGLVSNYLMASYAYEHLGEIYMEDTAYDRVCQRLDEQFDEVSHTHKHLIDRSALSATTGYYLKLEDYPLIVRSVASLLVNHAKTDSLYSFIRQDKRKD